MTKTKAKRGRKPHKPTSTTRRTVAEMRSCGEPEARIARALQIDVDTLKKHYGDELEGGIAQHRREVIGLLYKSARKGNVSAQKTLYQMTTAAASKDEFEDKFGDKRPEEAAPAPRAPKLGKKEIQRQEAVAAGANSDWGDDLAPPPGTQVN